MRCDEVRDLAGAYALGALPDAVRLEVDAHIAECRLHADFAKLQATAALLAYTAPERAPPPHLRGKLMQAIRHEADATPVAASRGRPHVPFRMPGWRTGLIAALVAAVLGLVAWNVFLQTLTPGADGVAVHRSFQDGASAAVVIRRDGRGRAFIVSGLRTAPADRTYQVWAITDDEPTGIALFNTDQTGSAVLTLDVDFSATDALAITDEPSGGSPRPTTQPRLVTQLQPSEPAV